MNSNKSFFSKAFPLLLVLLIDGMGLGLVLPILSALLFDPKSMFYHHLTATSSNYIYGLTISIFMLCWFFGSAVLGDLSDHIGRKKSLLICLLGACFSFVISAVSVLSASILLFLVGRVVGGLTSGSQPIAQAAIIDLSDDTTKTRNIGLILLAISFGFILGPVIGGILSDPHIVPWFNYSTPFIFAAVISLLNAGLLLWLFDETIETKRAIGKINLFHAVNIFVSAFRNQSVRYLSIVFFVFIFGWSSFYTFIPMFLVKTYALKPLFISFFMGLMGVGFALGNGVLINYFTKRFTIKNIILCSLVICIVCVIGMMTINGAWICWLLMPLLATAVALAYPAIITLFSNQVGPELQGWVMGISSSIMALVWAVNALIVGALVNYGVILSLLVSAAAFIGTVILMRLPHYKVKEVADFSPQKTA